MLQSTKRAGSRRQNQVGRGDGRPVAELSHTPAWTFSFVFICVNCRIDLSRPWACHDNVIKSRGGMI